MKKGNWWVVAGMVVAFTGLGTVWKDPDFGWHFRSGEIIVNEGWPEKDPFSYAMPSYPFVDYEWGTNVLWYLTYPVIGQVGWAMVYAVATVAAGWLVMPERHKKYWLISAGLFWAVGMGMYGVRAQVVSWLFLAAIIRGLNDERWRERWKWVYVPWMWIWGNVHGSYPVGLALVGIWLGIRGVLKRKWEMKDWLVWAGGVGATLINPYGWRNWEEVVKQISQTSYFAKTIAEWHPFWDKPDIGVLAGVALGIFGAMKFWRSIKWEYGVILAILGWMALTRLRHGPLLMLGLAPVLGAILSEIEQIAVKYKKGEERMKVFYRVVLGVVGVIVMLDGVLAGVNFYKFGKNFYPEKAVEYIKTSGVPERLFSTYGWGGYLIWELPDRRVFADGRMSGFSWEAPEGESDHAFEEYMETMFNLDLLPGLLDRYEVNAVLWEKNEPGTEFWGRLVGWGEMLFGKKEVERETVPERLEEMGWKKVYEDRVAVVFVRN